MGDSGESLAELLALRLLVTGGLMNTTRVVGDFPELGPDEFFARNRELRKTLGTESVSCVGVSSVLTLMREKAKLEQRGYQVDSVCFSVGNFGLPDRYRLIAVKPGIEGDSEILG